ncbi:unknown [Firmicutes bacterium CAG:884]|nr:unknown [Firmicutes bacterium CAG:884]
MIDLEDYNKYFHKRIGNLYLSQAEMDILDMYEIDYKKYNDIKLLMYEIEEVLEEEDSDELEWVLNELAEFNYYNNTKK